uniref:Uncharacterized protein n=1 Tax=Oryza meridionalis TaxID=40149 RepID=A0A0E0EY19_9ORYZ
NNPIQSLLNQKPSIPNIKTVAPAFSFRYSNPNNDAVIPKKITAHRISIRQQIKSLESLTAPEENGEAAFLLGGIEASSGRAEQEGRVQTVREGEAGWVEEEEEEERRRLGGSKEATAFALLLLRFHLNIALLHNSSAEEVRS